MKHVHDAHCTNELHIALDVEDATFEGDRLVKDAIELVAHDYRVFGVLYPTHKGELEDKRDWLIERIIRKGVQRAITGVKI